jgi:transposase
MGYNNVETLYVKNTLESGCTQLDFIEFLKLCNFQNKTGFKDGAKIHVTQIVKNFEENNNIEMIRNIPYMPEFNAIELLFNILKNHLRNRVWNENENIPKIVYDYFKSINFKTINNLVDYTWKNFN